MKMNEWIIDLMYVTQKLLRQCFMCFTAEIWHDGWQKTHIFFHVFSFFEFLLFFNVAWTELGKLLWNSIKLLITDYSL